MESEKQSFCSLVEGFNKGRSSAELDEALASVVNAIREYGGTGELVYKIKVSQEKADGVVVVEDEIKTKLPSKPRPGSIYFTTEENGLSRKDPRQFEMALEKPENVVDLSPTLQRKAV